MTLRIRASSDNKFGIVKTNGAPARISAGAPERFMPVNDIPRDQCFAPPVVPSILNNCFTEGQSYLPHRFVGGIVVNVEA
jgi:hypothetical protein